MLTRDICDILLTELALRLLSSNRRGAERRLDLRRSELTKRTALRGRVLEVRLTLQHADHLRHEGHKLPDHFIHILLAQLARYLAIGGVANARIRIRRIWNSAPGDDLRQSRTDCCTTSFTSCCES